MLRRSSRFKAEVYPTIILAESENGSILEQKWRQWVEAESFKRYVAEPKCNNIKILIGSRLVYHMFIHDVQASVLLSINPLISYVELDLPLPSCRKLWDAKSATDWKMFYLEKITNAPEPLPSLAQSIQNISILNQFREQIDFTLAEYISVHSMFTIVMDCNRARHDPSSQLRALVFQSWQNELQHILEQFEVAIVEPLHASVPDIYLIYQTVLLSLRVPLGELEVFAGRDGLKRSSDVYNNVIKHLSPTNLRQAIWHAGQVYRIVKSMPRGSLVGFCATCLYFAALTLWMYSNVCSAISLCLDTQQRNKEEDLFVLDRQIDSLALRRFILSGLGSPALSSKDEPAYLNNSAAVMRLFQEVLWSKHPSGIVRSQTQALYNAFSALGNDAGCHSSSREARGVL